MKKKLAILFSLVLMMVAFVGCSGSGASKKINLSDTLVSLEVLGEKNVSVWTENFTGDITWTNSNPESVEFTETLDGINIFAAKEGVAILTAECGDVTNSLTVIVSSNNGQQLVLTSLLDSEEGFIQGSTFDSKASVSYKGNPFAKAKIVYVTDTDGIISVDENGVISALSPGETNLTIYADFNGVKSNTLNTNIKVYPCNFLKTDTNEITMDIYHELYTNPAYPTSYNLGVQFVNNGQEVTGITFESISSNPNVATYNNGVITSYINGETDITVYYDYEGVRYFVTVKVIVKALPDSITNLYESDGYDDSAWAGGAKEDPWMKDQYNKQ